MPARKPWWLRLLVARIAIRVDELLARLDDPVCNPQGLIGDAHRCGMDPFKPISREWESPVSDADAASREHPGARLRYLRCLSGRTMGEVARYLGTNVSEISAIEAGWGFPRPERAR